MSLTPTQNDALERVGRALADATRRRLLSTLLDGPAYPAQLARGLGVGRANVSNHLACLRACGLVTATAEGRQTRYELADTRLAHALRDLLQIALEVEGGHTPLDVADGSDGAELFVPPAALPPTALPPAALPPAAALWRRSGGHSETTAGR